MPADRFRSKPQEIEAIQWDGSLATTTDLNFWFGIEKFRRANGGMELLAGKDGAQDWVPVPVGHWIVRKPGDDSDYWPVDDRHFRAKYEPVPSGEGGEDQ